MRGLSVIIISILQIFCSFSNAKTTPTEEYWKIVMKDVPMPKAVRDLVDSDSTSYDYLYNKEENDFTRDFGEKLGLLEDYLKYSSSNKKNYLKRNFDKKFEREVYYHPSNPGWFDKYIQYEIMRYLFDAPDYVKSYFARNLDRKSPWEYYLSTYPRWDDALDSVSSNKKNFFTREFDREHAWEWYYN